MTLHKLDNARWGLDFSCFVCEQSNPSGLQISFLHDDEAAVVRATFSLGEAFCGAPSYVHGGVVLAVMDEAMAWGAIALARVWALTRHSEATFLRPVRIGQAHEVVARLLGRGEDGTLSLAAEVVRHDADGAPERCAEASATFVTLTDSSARAALGEPTRPDHASYLRARPSSE